MIDCKPTIENDIWKWKNWNLSIIITALLSTFVWINLSSSYCSKHIMDFFYSYTCKWNKLKSKLEKSERFARSSPPCANHDQPPNTLPKLVIWIWKLQTLRSFNSLCWEWQSIIVQMEASFHCFCKAYKQKKLAPKSFCLVIKKAHSVNITSLYFWYDSVQGPPDSAKYNARAVLY